MINNGQGAAGQSRLGGILRGATFGLGIGVLIGLAADALNPEFVDSNTYYIIVILLPWIFLGAIAGAILPGKRRFSRIFTVAVIILSIIPPAISNFSIYHARSRSLAPRLLVIGIDGATWDIINPMMARGELSNFSRIKKSGASGVFQSERPIASPPVWTTIATGQPRNIHGVQTFYNTQLDCRSPRFWEILNQRRGLSYGTYMWMTTWPPTGKGVFEFPDWTALDYSTKPSKLGYLQKFFNDGAQGMDLRPSEEFGLGFKAVPWGMRLSILTKLAILDVKRAMGRGAADDQRFFINTIQRAALHPLVARKLLDKYKPGVAVFSMYAIDELSHLFWNVQPGAAGGNEVAEAYRMADKSLGYLLDLAGPQTLVAVVSDHGFQGLQNEGRFNVPAAENILSKLSMQDKLKVVVVGKRAYFFCPPGAATDSEEKQILAAALNKLNGFRANDQPLFKSVTVFGGIMSEIDNALQEQGNLKLICSFEGNNIPCGELMASYKVKGTHSLDGIIMLMGPNIRKGAKISNASVYDLTPTLLHLFGLPVGKDMQGKVLGDAIDAAWVAEHPVQYIASYPQRDKKDLFVGGADFEAMEKRLRALGYIQ